MKDYDSTQDTVEHSQKVFDYAQILAQNITQQCFLHDKSKTEEPEKELFDEFTPKLKHCEYNSDEYKQYLKDLKPALDHHYAVNRHHPEHFENGMNGMTLVDLIEYFCDCVAAAKRMKDKGNPVKSFEVNMERHQYGDVLKNIFINTLPLVETKEDDITGFINHMAESLRF